MLVPVVEKYTVAIVTTVPPVIQYSYQIASSTTTR